MKNGIRITTFATGLDDPHGVLSVGDSLYIADVKIVWKVDAKGKVEVYLGTERFPRAPGYLNDIASGGKGGFYVSDSGDRAGKRGPCRYSATAGRSS
jgi:gluconolactonase